LNIIAFMPTGDWEGNTRRRLFLALAQKLREHGGRLLAINRPITPLVTLATKPGKLAQWLRSRSSVEQVERNVFTLTPFLAVHDLLAPMVPFAKAANRALLRSAIDNAARARLLRRDRLVVWISHPVLYYWAQLFPEAVVAYECWDAHELFPNVQNNPLRRVMLVRQERQLLLSADVVFATAEELVRTRGRYCPETHYVPNACDYGPFANPKEVDEALPGPLTAGFVGSINDAFDFELLEYAARTLQDMQFVVIGRVTWRHASRPARKFFAAARTDPENTHYLGPRRYTDVPGLVKQIGVCLIPFVLSERTKSVSPNKLHEYLAAGKPVVSTDLPEVRQFRGVVYIARSKEEPAALVRRAIAEDSPEKRKQREAVARANTWDARAAYIIDVLRRVGERKSARKHHQP